MSDKGYILVNIPNECSECDFGLFVDEHMRGVCMANKLEIIPKVTNLPEWCPIKKLPKEDDENYFPDEFMDGIATGWNMCLRKIKGESNL